MITFNPAATAALSPAALIQFATKDWSEDARWRTARHLEYLDGLLLDAVSGKRKRLLISVGPRMGSPRLYPKPCPHGSLERIRTAG